jgi:hypothetical protein
MIPLGRRAPYLGNFRNTVNREARVPVADKRSRYNLHQGYVTTMLVRSPWGEAQQIALKSYKTSRMIGSKITEHKGKRALTSQSGQEKSR